MKPLIRTLLVEDDPDTSRLFARRLASSRAANFEVVRANDLQSALYRIECERFDAVVLDLGLPDGDPMSTLALAGALAQHIPILVLTAWEDNDLAVLAARLGCQEYLVKAQASASVMARSVLGAIARHRWIRAEEPGPEQAALEAANLQELGGVQVTSNP